MEVIKDENGKEITVELVLVKKESIHNTDCGMCCLDSQTCDRCCDGRGGYFVDKKDLT